MSEKEQVAGWSNSVIYALSLSDEEMAFRQKFVKQYLVDYDSYAACLRMGLAPGLSYQYSVDLLDDSYVQHLLALQTYGRDTTSEDKAAEEERERQRTKQQIIEALKREAFNHGPGSKQSARVAALAKLASLYGLEKGSAADDDDSIPKGGVMLVPAMLTPDQWEQVAQASQNKLAEESLRDVDEGA